jgi:hypothetical protein
VTDELDQTAIGEPEATETAGETESAFEPADATMSASIPRISDIGLEDVGDAAKWAWKHTLGYKREKPPEPGGISIDLPMEEETTMRSSSVAHEDPPPPPPPEDAKPD